MDRQVVQLQVIVCVDESRQQPIAPQVEHHILRFRRYTHSGNSRSLNAQTADVAATHLSIDEGDIHLFARTTNTMGSPFHCR